MLKPIHPRIGLELSRYASSNSTQEGGSLSPQTTESTSSTASPLGGTVRMADSCVSAGSLCPRPSCTTIVASTNLINVNLREGYSVMEYRVEGGMDLACMMYEEILLVTGSMKLVLFPCVDITMVVAIVVGNPGIHSRRLPRGLGFVRRHDQTCGCFDVCQRLLKYLIENWVRTRVPKVGRQEYLSTGGLCVSPSVIGSVSCVGLPGILVKPTCELGNGGGISVAIDISTSWLGTSSYVENSLLHAIGTSGGRQSMILNRWVYTTYNFKPYRVKSVRFDMTPTDTFYNKRENRFVRFCDQVMVSYPEFRITVLDSPMIEVFAEHRSEQCFVIPEFVRFFKTSSPPVEKNMALVHKETRIAPNLRKFYIEGLIAELLGREGVCGIDGHLGLSGMDPHHLLECRRVDVIGGCIGRAWEQERLVESSGVGQPVPPITVLFEGTESRWRNSLGDQFLALLGMPVRAVVCVTQEWEKKTDICVPGHLVLLIVQSKREYAKWKFRLLVELGVACQVVRWETIEKIMKRNDKLLTNLRHQLSTKFGGTKECATYRHNAKKIFVGLDFHRFGDLGVLSVSVCGGADSVRVKYALRVVGAEHSGCHDSIGNEEIVAMYMQLVDELFVDCGFARRSCECECECECVFIFASRRRPDVVLIGLLNSAIERKFQKYTLLNCLLKSDVRFFSFDGSAENVQPGFVLNSNFGLETAMANSFYYVPHKVVVGNALPLHFIIVGNSCNLPLHAVQTSIQELWQPDCCDTSKTSHKLPIPLVHTEKLSELVGVHLRKGMVELGLCKKSNQSVSSQLDYYLKNSCGWNKLIENGIPFYL